MTQVLMGDAIWREVHAERLRAHAKHGDTSMESQPAGALDRLLILTEELGEVAELFMDARHGPLDNRDHLVSLLRRIIVAGEVARRLNDQRHSGAGPWPALPNIDTRSLRKELIQVAAMAGAWADVLAPTCRVCSETACGGACEAVETRAAADPEPEWWDEP